MKDSPAIRATWRRSAAYGAAMALATCLTQVASAEPRAVGEAEPSEPVKARARLLFQEGNSLLDGGEYATALERFEQARSLWDSPKIQLNIATTQRALGQLAAAANSYALYLEKAPPDSPARAEAKQILDALTETTGRVVISNLEGVERVLLDGVELPVKTGRETWVEAGEHVLTTERRGGSAIRRTFSVFPAEVARVELDAPARNPRVAAPMTATQKDAPKENQPAPESSMSPFGLSARLDLDPKWRGAAAAAGIRLDITDHLRLTGGALLGARKGGWVGVDYIPWGGDVRPFVGVAAPTFYVGSLYAGVAAHCGLGYRITSRVVPFVHVALVHFPAAPTGYVKTVFVPAAGIEVPL